METYPLDISAEQIIKWLIDEEREGRHGLQISASRTFLREDISDPSGSGLGEEEREDLTEVIEVGSVEVWPQQKASGWLLRLRIEDALTQRLPEDASSSEQAEEIDLTAFEQEFISKGQGTAFVAVDAETPEAWSSFQALLHEMQTNSHLR